MIEESEMDLEMDLVNTCKVLAEGKIPNTMFAISSNEFKKDEYCIRFEAYDKLILEARARKDEDPCHSIARSPSKDFFLNLAPGSSSISSYWKEELLSVEFVDNDQFKWKDYDDRAIPRPYPLGEEFEDLLKAVDRYREQSQPD